MTNTGIDIFHFPMPRLVSIKTIKYFPQIFITSWLTVRYNSRNSVPRTLRLPPYFYTTTLTVSLWPVDIKPIRDPRQHGDFEAIVEVITYEIWWVLCYLSTNIESSILVLCCARINRWSFLLRKKSHRTIIIKVTTS